MSANIDKFNPIENFAKSSEAILESCKNAKLKKIQENAKDELLNSKFPTLKVEDWKYTNPKKLLAHRYLHSANLDNVRLNEKEIREFKFNSFDSYLLVLVNGVLEKELSDYVGLEDDLVISTISEALNSENILANKYFSKISKINSAFDLVNLSNFVDGLFIQVPDNKIIEKPIQILNVVGNKREVSFYSTRNLIIAGKNSEATFIQKHVGIDGELYLNNLTSEFAVEQNATLNFYNIELDNNDSYHIEKTDVMQARDSNFRHFNFTFGGKLVRNDMNTELSDENVECTLNGLYIANDSQHVDNSTFINHAKPHSTSNELYKGILDDTSRGVFSGKILVAKDAQLTNAYQNNNTILLSEDAQIDTKPQLEIYADDVKCTHGATVGQLDESALFYILSRGIPKEKAKSMLITAFAESVVAEVSIPELKDEINHYIFQHLNRDEIS